MVQRISSARRPAKGRKGEFQPWTALRRLAIVVALALLVYGAVVAVRALYSSPNVSRSLANAVVLLAVAVAGSVVVRMRLGRLPAWVLVATIGIGVFTFLLGVVDLGGFFGSQEGRKTIQRLDMVLPGEAVTVPKRDLARISTFREEVEAFLEYHSRINRIYRHSVQEIVAAKGGRRGPVVREAALADPLALARAISTLETIQRHAEEASTRLEGIVREAHHRFARRDRTGRWKPNGFGAKLLCNHVQEAKTGMVRYVNTVKQTLRFLHDVTPGEVAFSEDHELLAAEAGTGSSLRFTAMGVLVGQKDFARLACCPLDDVQLIPELRMAGYEPR